jgi:hypothetical protein
MNCARRTLALGLPVEDEPLRLLCAMTLGWRTAFSGDISDPFLQAGTINEHLFRGMVETSENVEETDAYAAGLLLGQVFTLPLVLLFLVSFALLVPVMIFDKLRPWLLWPLLALAGWTNLVLHTASVDVLYPSNTAHLA